MTGTTTPIDAVLFISFGGPEGPDDVLPFLENVLRGRNVPRERMLEVAEHYLHFGGVSPINAQIRELIAAVREDFQQNGVALPIYWGNRNWHPLLPATMQEMMAAGVRRALGFVVSAYSSYSSCRQYRENIEAARQACGENAPTVEKIRVFYNHPDFIAANVDRLQESLAQLTPSQRERVVVAFTAHSIPQSMADTSDYVQQLSETMRLVAEAHGIPPERRQLVYQSRSGRPQDPWLAPDIGDHLRSLHTAGVTDVIINPIGFLSDHMEVLFDLDLEAADISRELGLNMIRTKTVGTHSRFVTMIRKLIQERINAVRAGECVGQYGPAACRENCCLPPARPRA